MKKLFLFLFLFVPILAQAYTAKIDGIYYDFYNNGAVVTYYSSSANSNAYSGAVTIPSSVTYNSKRYSVISIGDRAFYGCSGLTSIAIPNSVMGIGKYAFAGCSGLTSVNIPNSVTSIGERSFQSCSGLVSITVPNSVISIDSYAFIGCSQLTSVNIPNSVTSIGDLVFSDCTNLAEPIIVNGMFVRLPMSYNGHYTIPSGITNIIGGAFEECCNLTSVTIPNSVTSIGDYAFSGCSSLASVTIPNSVTTIGIETFDGCSSLTEPIIVNDMFVCLPMTYNGHYTIASGITKIKEAAFAFCSNLTSVKIPNSVTSIGYSAFYNCTSLAAVEIPNSVTDIGVYAFNGCSALTSLEIPNSVKNIAYAFSGSSLTSLTNLREIPQSSNGKLPVSCIVHVPTGCKEAYKQSTAWSAYNIVDDVDTSVKVSSINLSATSLEVQLGDEFELTATVLPSNADNKEVEWTVSNPSVAFHIGDTWFATGEGTTTITATAKDGSGVSASCTVTVVSPVEVSSINLSATSLEVQLGDEFELTATVLPNDADNKEVEWTVSNPAVVFHIGNTWFAAGEGTATITATAKDGSGVSASCTVTVVSGGDDTPSDDIIPSTNIDDFDNALYFNDVEHRAGDFNLALNMKCAEENITAFQCDIYLPEGVTWKSTTDRRGNVVYTLPTFNEDRTDDSYHTIAPIVKNADGSYNIMVYSMDVETILEHDGVLMTLPLEISENMPTGDYNIFIRKIVMTTIKQQQFKVDEIICKLTVPSYEIGDANGDGEINITDIVATIAYIRGNAGDNFIVDAANVNGDGDINITDVVGIIAIIRNNISTAKSMNMLRAKNFTLARSSKNNLEVIPFTLSEGTTSAIVKLDMNNPSDEFSAFQCDVVFPEGIEWASTVDKRGNKKYTQPIFNSDADRTDATYHTVDVGEKANGTMNIMVYSMDEEVFLDESGTILDMPFVFGENLAPGVYDITLKNIVMTRTNQTQVKPADYTFSVLVGSPAESSLTLNGNYTDEAINEYNTALAGNTTVAAIDLSNAVNVSNNTTIATGNENLVLYVAEGKTVANTNNVVTGDECSKLVLTDGYSFSAPNTFTAASASYTRAMSTTWGTVCLPYEVQSNGDVEYYHIEGIQDNVLVLAQCATLPANTPALMKKLSGDAVVCSASNVAVGGTINETSGTVTMHGSYTNDTRVEDANAYYIKNDKFWLNNGYFFIDAFRAYFTTNNVGAKSLNIEGLATGIDALMNSNNSVIGVWDANGVKRGSVDKGMNVVKMNDGKCVKIFVK